MSEDKKTIKLYRLIVMVVDDDEMIRRIIIEHLKAMGFRTFLEASDGTEAYKFIVDPGQRVA